MQQAFQGFSHSDASDGLDLDHWAVCCGPEHCSLCLAVPPVQHSSGSTIYVPVLACRAMSYDTVYGVLHGSLSETSMTGTFHELILHVPTKQWLCKYIKCGYAHVYLAWYAHVQCIMHI